MLRRYHIKNGQFNLIRYYYMDPWCTTASFSVLAVGSFSPPPEKASSSSISWVVPGGIELDFSFKKVAIVPFTTEAARSLSQMVNISCPNLNLRPWRPFRKYKVLSYDEQRNRKRSFRSGLTNDFDCTRNFDFNFNELLLTRLEHRSSLRFLSQKTHSKMLRRHSSHLFLGVEGSRRGSRPTYYQEPLLLAQTENCAICLNLVKSSWQKGIKSPPTLAVSYDTSPPRTGLEGQWISLRCEVRPYGLFLYRTFIFGYENQGWQAQHSYFKDPQCLNPMFTLSAKGTYYPGPPSSIIEDAVEYDFHIKESFLTPHDKQFSDNLNGLLNCGSGTKWQVGQIGNLTSSGGCEELGIIVPSVEEDLVRFEKLSPDLVYLYLGETPDGKTRPTSFQPPLVRCSSPESNREEDHLFNYNEIQPLPLISGSYSARVSYLMSFLLVTLTFMKL
ncbi:protein APCDD1 isoform X2 [Parasteatoda tepidariorum]